MHNWTGKRTYTRALCQKNEGYDEIKQAPVGLFTGHCHLILTYLLMELSPL
jgi:hypothetical protein